MTRYREISSTEMTSAQKEVHDEVGIDPVLQSALADVSDPNQLLPTIQAFIGGQNPTAAAQPAQPKSPPQLYAITQPGGGPSYVGALTTDDVAWWQGAGATLTPYTGAAPATRQGATLYQITQPGGGPSYVGDLTASDASWWQGAGASLTPYGTLPAARPGAALYSITQTSGPSYLGDLAPADVAWWQDNGATVAPSGAAPRCRRRARVPRSTPAGYPKTPTRQTPMGPRLRGMACRARQNQPSQSHLPTARSPRGFLGRCDASISAALHPQRCSVAAEPSVRIHFPPADSVGQRSTERLRASSRSAAATSLCPGTDGPFLRHRARATTRPPRSSRSRPSPRAERGR